MVHRVKLFLATAVFLGVTSTAQAGPITIDLSADPDILIGATLVGTTNNNDNLSISEINSIFGVTVGNLLYKAEAPNEEGDPVQEEGPGAPFYTTTFSNTPTDPSDALITRNGPNYASCGTCYLLVKDGNQYPAQYLFDISGWDGKSDINLVGFWPDKGAISNVQIFGARVVPEPATLTTLLLGLGLLGVGSLRRRATA